MNKQRVIRELTKAIAITNVEEELNCPPKTIAEYLYKDIERLKWLNSMREVVKPDFKDQEMFSEHDGLGFSCEVKDIGEDLRVLALMTGAENDVNDFVDRMYALYPTKCPKRNASLGKSRKDKDRIKKLLKTYSKEQIEQVIRNEVDSNYGVNYMKNFSTFLNNFPEPNDSATKTSSPANGEKTNVLVINGQVYK